MCPWVLLFNQNPSEGPERGCLPVTGEHRLAYQQSSSTAVVSKTVGAKRGGEKLDALIKVRTHKKKKKKKSALKHKDPTQLHLLHIHHPELLFHNTPTNY